MSWIHVSRQSLKDSWFKPTPLSKYMDLLLLDFLVLVFSSFLFERRRLWWIFWSWSSKSSLTLTLSFFSIFFSLKMNLDIQWTGIVSRVLEIMAKYITKSEVSKFVIVDSSPGKMVLRIIFNFSSIGLIKGLDCNCWHFNLWMRTRVDSHDGLK